MPSDTTCQRLSERPPAVAIDDAVTLFEKVCADTRARPPGEPPVHLAPATLESDAPAPAFGHRQSVHCENGVISTLLHAAGLTLSENMCFGLSSALSFCYFPLARIDGLPLISYRMPPRWILKSLKRILRLPLRFERFRDPASGRRRLDELLAAGRPVGLQGDVFYLTHIPDAMRFHFNAHQLIVYGRDSENGDYFVSDVAFNVPTRCRATDLQSARFARGPGAARGLLYHLDGPLPSTDPAQIVPLLPAAIRKNASMMFRTPLPFTGVCGIRMFAARAKRLPAGKAPDHCRRYLGHVVRMQEMIGTGGAGFRFLYAAFLQEAAALLNKPALRDLSLELISIGGKWRAFALEAARQNKGRAPLDPPALADLLTRLSTREYVFFKKLWKAV